MSKTSPLLFFPLALTFLLLIIPQTTSFTPYTRPTLFDMIDDPFKILEQTPLPIHTKTDMMDPTTATTTFTLARADWKETPTSHVITLDVPGLKKEDLKIEVEENRVVKVSGARKGNEVEVEGEKWHRAERAHGNFWRQFRLPYNADLEHIRANLQDGVLKIVVPKIVERKREAKVVNIDDVGVQA